MILKVQKMEFDSYFNYFPAFKVTFMYKTQKPGPKGEIPDDAKISIPGNFNLWDTEYFNQFGDIPVIGSDYQARVIFFYPGVFQYRYYNVDTESWVDDDEMYKGVSQIELNEFGDKNYVLIIDPQDKNHIFSTNELLEKYFIQINNDPDNIFYGDGTPLERDIIFNLNSIEEVNIGYLEKGIVVNDDLIFKTGTPFLEFSYENYHKKIYFQPDAYPEFERLRGSIFGKGEPLEEDKKIDEKVEESEE